MRQRFGKGLLSLAVFFMLAVLAAPVQAALLDVGPTDLPSPPGNGFPFWYRDTNRLALEPCLSQAVLPSGPACVLLADPGFNPALPAVFPTNYPIETFFFVADNVFNMGVGGGFKVKYRVALEGSFGTGIVTPGQQITFARVRVFADVPVAGTYIVTHPFGVETITATTAGTRAIAFTRDIGVAAGIFTGAVAGDIGPWLIMTGYPQTIGTETFIGDPNIANTVTGSPFGTNFVRIQGPAGSNLDGAGGNVVTSNLFTVAGKTAVGGLATPLTVDKSTYTRDATTTAVSVFATTQPISNATIPGTLTLANTASALQFNDSTGVISATTMTTNNPKDGKFYGNVSFANPLTFPTTVTVTNTADVPPSATTVPLVDEVSITEASYASTAKILKVTAVSGDKFALPALTVVMQDGAVEIPLGTITGGGGALSVPFPFSFSTPAGIKIYEIPPVRVTVRSALGGSDTEVVTGLAANTPPVARNDVATVGTNASVIINVVANDTDPDLGDFVVPSSVTIVTPPISGSAASNVNGLGTITYTSGGVAGTATFTYTVKDSFGAVSNVATVTVTITAPPVATNDTATTNEDTVVTTNVIANDTPLANLVPASVTVVVQPLHGTAASLGNGAVVYTPALNYNGADSYQYTVRDTAGIVSNIATASITINPVADAPIAVNDTATTAGNTPVTINVVANDIHPDGLPSAIDPATVAIAASPLVSAGTASVVAGGQVLFTPAANFFGTATFTYIVSDNTASHLTSAPATVTVTVTPVNVAPVANNDAATATVGIPRVINVLANDTDLNGNIAPGTVVIASAPTPTGTAVANVDGTVTFTASTSGTDTFTYNVKDTAGAVSNNATVSVSVAAAAPTDSVTILKAQYTLSTGQWVVEGTTTGVAPASRNVTVYVGSTTTGPIITAVPTNAADGRWKFSLTFGANQLSPAPTNTISASLPSGASFLAFPAVVR